MSNFDINSPEFENEYLVVLDSETVDAYDGCILNPGQVVIRSPQNHSLVVADSQDHRLLFKELGFVWDEPTRFSLVKDEIDRLSIMFSFGSIRTTDVANNLNMSIAVIEDIFDDLVQTRNYIWGADAKDSNGQPCKVIVKRK
ncbi:MAG: hypothetical protein IKS45_12595 [Thermoguttaceae bacterium]|nr:hypothetical protein [Thermoguttaceae bacterium]